MPQMLVLQRHGCISFKSSAVTLTILGSLTSVKLVWLPQGPATSGYPNWLVLKCSHMCYTTLCSWTLLSLANGYGNSDDIISSVKCTCFGWKFVSSWFRVQARFFKIPTFVNMAAYLVWSIHNSAVLVLFLLKFTCQWNT